jgi:hypothetical protein
MGKYHGRYSFGALTNARSVFYHGAKIGPAVKYPPIPSTGERTSSPASSCHNPAQRARIKALAGED